jgi:trk system potassium uptake protein TrkH
MVNFKIVSKIIGQLLFLESMFMSWCLMMALCYREDDVMAFLLSIILVVGCGLIFMYFGRNASNNLSRRDASLTVTLVWIIFSFFGMMPFLIGGYINNVAGAYLETMSGFTTTGATVIDNVECLPHGILFWRSLTHWIGGLGIVFFTIAVLPSMVGGSVKIFAAEATGPIKSKMHPRLTTSAKWIWIVYIGLTLACVLSYYFTGMGWFDSFCYSMSTTATGGFGTHNTSILNSAAL